MSDEESEDFKVSQGSDDSEYDERKFKLKRKTIEKKKKRLVKNSKKSKKFEITARKYLDVEAEESESEGESDFDENDLAYKKERAKIDESNDYYNVVEELYKKPRAKDFYRPKGLELANPDEINEYYEQRINENNYDMDEDEEEFEDYDRKADLPNLRDPKVFAVQCKMGMEKETLESIFHKSIAYKSKGIDFGIFTASYFDKFTGYLYIETHKESNIRNNFQDIPGLLFKGGSMKIKIIPIKEIPQLYTNEESKSTKFKLGQWVRVKSGKYGGELARVVDYSDNKGRIELKLVPIVAKEGEEAKKRLVFPDKVLLFFNKEPEFAHLKDKFIDGFLIKRFSARMIQTIDIVPTLDEIETFANGEMNEASRKKVREEGLIQMDLVKCQGNRFQKGDKIKVTEGELQNLTGTVLSIKDNIVTIMPQVDQVTEPMEMPPSQLIKFFNEGERVKVVEGPHTGVTGIVSKLNERIATLILNNQNTIRTHVNELQLTTHESSTLEKNQFDIKRFDLVRMMSSGLSAVVLKTSKDSVEVIDENQHIQTIPFYAIESKINDRNVFAKNVHDHEISIDASIKVKDGINKGKIGTVKHIYNDTLFLYNPDFTIHSGIFVEKANNSFLITKNYKKFQKATNFSFKDRNSLVGKLCTVKLGPYKGYQGIIIEEEVKFVRIELTSKPKVITVNIEHIHIAGTSVDDDKNKYKMEGRTPNPQRGSYSIRAQSPFYQGQSPSVHNVGWGMPSPGYDNSAFR